MNKNKFNKISKSIFLQNIISKQLFYAIRNHNKLIDDSIGSFAGRNFSTLSGLFQIFIGSFISENIKGFNQIIQKNGNSYKIYPVSSDNKMDNNRQPFAIFNDLQSLAAYFNSNISSKSHTSNSLSQILRELISLIKITDSNQILQSYIQKSLQKFNNNKLSTFYDVYVDVIEQWSIDLEDKFNQIESIKTLVPIVFDQNNLNNFTNTLNSLQNIVNKNLEKYVSNFNLSDEQESNKIDFKNEIKKIISKYSVWISQSKQVQNISHIASKYGSQQSLQNDNLSKTMNILGTVGQHVIYLNAIVNKLKKNLNLIIQSGEASFKVSDVLQSILDSNNNLQLGIFGKINLNEAMLLQEESDFIVDSLIQKNQKNLINNEQSSLSTFLKFLSGTNNKLNFDNWLKTKQSLQKIYEGNEQVKNIINKFDNIVNLLRNIDFIMLINKYRLIYNNKDFINQVIQKLSLPKWNNNMQLQDFISGLTEIKNMIDHKPYNLNDNILNIFNNIIQNTSIKNQISKVGLMKQICENQDIKSIVYNFIVKENLSNYSTIIYTILDNLRYCQNYKNTINRLIFSKTGILQQLIKICFPNS